MEAEVEVEIEMMVDRDSPSARSTAADQKMSPMRAGMNKRVVVNVPNRFRKGSYRVTQRRWRIFFANNRPPGGMRMREVC